MTTYELVTVVALFAGPIVAIQLTEWMRRRKELKDRREQVFQTLMSTRSATLASSHIEALNLVDVLFHGQKPRERRVVDSWRLYLSHLNDTKYPRETWHVKANELLHDLLFEMGMLLGYSFERSQIKAGTYYPHGYEDADRDHWQARKLWLEVLRGERALAVAMYSGVPSPTAVHEAEEVKPAIPKEAGE